MGVHCTCAQPGVGDGCKSVHMEARSQVCVCVCVRACPCRYAHLEEWARVARSVCTLRRERQAGVVPIGVFERVHMCAHRKERRSGVCLCGCAEETVCACAAPCLPGAHLFLPGPRSPCPRPASAQIPSPLDCSSSPGGLGRVESEPWRLAPRRFSISRARAGGAWGPSPEFTGHRGLECGCALRCCRLTRHLGRFHSLTTFNLLL